MIIPSEGGAAETGNRERSKGVGKKVDTSTCSVELLNVQVSKSSTGRFETRDDEQNYKSRQTKK